jgi:predicted GNAT family acetyltransferase
LRLVLTRDPREFADRVSGFLEARIERNVAATVLTNLLAGDYPDTGFLFGYGVEAGGEPCLAVLRVPPSPLLATDARPAAARALMARWLEADPEVPGVSGLPETARGLAAAWCELTGGTSRCAMREAMHVLEHVQDPHRPAPGGLRPAEPGDRELLIEWTAAFAHEAGVPGADQAERLVDRQLTAGRLFVWDDVEPVSMVGTAPVIAGVARIGPVYTPPERRRRGYAASAVAAASRDALAGAARRCALYTDLANPTSNKIYAEVGYRRIADWEEHAFERG